MWRAVEGCVQRAYGEGQVFTVDRFHVSSALPGAERSIRDECFPNPAVCSTACTGLPIARLDLSSLQPSLAPAMASAPHNFLAQSRHKSIALTKQNVLAKIEHDSLATESQWLPTHLPSGGLRKH